MVPLHLGPWIAWLWGDVLRHKQGDALGDRAAAELVLGSLSEYRWRFTIYLGVKAAQKI